MTMQFTIRDAVPQDSKGLIALTSLAPMKGTIGLRIDRKPDFFSLLNLSESFIMFVAENNAQQIIGCFAATKNKMNISGETSFVYYLRDLKVHPDYIGSSVAYQLVKKMYSTLLKEGADILCCTMASGNDVVVPFFKGRAGIPAFTEVAKYNIYQLLPKCNSNFLNNNETADVKMLADFFNQQFKKYSISPAHIQPHELKDCVHFLSATKENINAAIAAFDPYPYRQNIVTHYSFSIATLLVFLKLLKLFFKLPSLPKKNEPLKIIYARYYAFISGNEHLLKNVIEQLRHYAFKEDYNLLAIATDERDKVMNKLLKSLSRFVFKSLLLATSLRNNEDVLCQMKQCISYEDYSLV